MNTVFENTVIENKMTDLMNTKIDAQSLMTIDTGLTEGAGLRKTVNRYIYSGAVEVLGKGAANTSKGTITFVPSHYDVKRYQQTFEYNDMDVMQDPYMLDAAMAGAASVMANEIKDEYFSELSKVSNTFGYTGETITYSDIVDALATLNREVEDDLFIIMGADSRASIRKDPDFISAKQGEIVYSGQFGTICGIPVLYSKKVTVGKVFITNKESVKFFVKKEATVEQDRNIETKDNTVVYERHGLVALVDDTSSVILGKQGGVITVTKGSFSGSGENRKVYLTTDYTLGSGESFKVACDKAAPFYGENVDTSLWTAWNGELAVKAPEGCKFISVVVEKGGVCIMSGKVSV